MTVNVEKTKTVDNPESTVTEKVPVEWTKERALALADVLYTSLREYEGSAEYYGDIAANRAW